MSRRTPVLPALHIAGNAIEPGNTYQLNLPLGSLYTSTNVTMPVYVRRSSKPGPTLFISAAIHGDELNGVEIINRLIHGSRLRNLRGTLIAVPIVNAFGVINQSRYLPDRRDLNRSFPGSSRGTLAGRMAYMFLNEVVAKCDYGIDLHTGAIHRSNLPQIRANLDDEITRDMALAFGVPVLLNANLRDGSLRESADEMGVKILLYEAGEALRYDELCIRAGERGILRVMRHLGMLPPSRQKKFPIEPLIARDSGWMRATDSGFVRNLKHLGDKVEKDDVMAIICDPFGTQLDKVVARKDGIIIGCQNIPLVHEGDAMFNVAYFSEPDDVVESIENMHDSLLPDDTILQN
ncbi:succinylglutamate desuccinylase/aspartoacylase family protein [Candidatus Thalassolituus haligoni]|uniref:succinylglutamate desuccinylase/aspartoacylase family protein n=1 Tax=Candidatus Thalassolituus haligoni TaxID=3100113 RepID=UPI003513C8F6|tara:strand:- start:1805 stop:2851 length:1047 start_codon:yes stop_codon:yes gene_type:complete